MSRHHTRALLDLGRKAGLRTGELYVALSTRQPLPGENRPSERDTNGFIERVDAQGHRSYEPTDERRP